MFYFIIYVLLVILVVTQIFFIINKVSIFFYFLIFIPTIVVLFFAFEQRKIKSDKKLKKIENKENLFFENFKEHKILNLNIIILFSFMLLLLGWSYFFKNTIQIIIQIFILILSVVLFLISKEKKCNYISKKNNLEPFILLILITISCIFRLVFWGEKPEGINTDEELFAKIGLEISQGNDPQTPFIGESDHQMGSPAYYLTGIFFKLFGVNLFSLRLFSNLSGILSIISFYIFLRLFFSCSIAALTTLLFATNSVYIHVTRWMHIFQATPFFIWLGFFFLIAGFRQKNLLFIIFSGILIGWSIYFYNSNKFLPIIFLLYIIYEIFINSKEDKQFNLKTISLFIISFFIAFLPLGIYIINNYNTYFLHISGVKASLNQIFSKIPLYLGMLTFKGSPNPWLNLPNMPLLDRISSFFFLIGFAISFLTIKKRESFIAILLYLIGLIPAVFSNYWAEPNNQRGIIVFSVSFLFIAVAINFLFSFSGKQGIVMRFLLFFLILFSSINGVLTYFNKMLKNSDIIWSFSPYEYKIQKIYKDNLKNFDIYFSKFFWGGNFGNRPFIGEEIYFYKLQRPKILYNIFHSINNLLMFDFGNKDVMLVLESFYKDSQNFILKRFPNATFEIIKNTYGMPKWEIDPYVLSPDIFNRDILFFIVKIPKTDIENFQGFNFYSENNKNIIKLFLDGNDLKPTSSGIIQGSIRIFQKEEYIFKLEGFKLKMFEIDGQKIKFKNELSEPIKLYPGIHPIRIKVENLNGNEKLLFKKLDESKFSIIPPNMLIKEFSNCGFKAKIYKNRLQKEVLWEEISPVIYNKWWENAIPGRVNYGWQDSMRVIWECELYIEKDGNYLFECQSPGGDVFIYIDDKVVFTYKSSEGGRKINSSWIDLKSGRYKFKLISDPFSNGTTNLLTVKIKENDKIRIIDDECLFKFR